MVVKRAALVTALLAVIGLVIAANIALLHHNLATSPGTTSWCNINGEVNCDVVLSSEYASLFGVPIAHWAILTYLGIAIAALVAAVTQSASRRRQMGTVLFIVASWGVLFSLYLAFISLFVLHTVCVMCSGLYVVHLGLFVSTFILYSAVRGPVRTQRTWQARARIVAMTSGAFALLLLGIVGWKAVSGDEMLTPEEIQHKDPAFYAWYAQLPTVAEPVPGGHAKGHDDAVVTVIEFSDFECGHCANAYRSLKEVLPRYQKDVQVRFHHFPLDSACNPAVKHPMHQNACLAALAAECAAAQDRFWEYHDLLFDNQSRLDRDSLIAYAEKLGLNRNDFVTCLGSDAPRQALARDVEEGMRLGIESTPTFFLNGRTINGAPRANQLGYAIQLERAAKQRGEG